MSANHSARPPELPSLRPGIRLLETDAETATGPLDALVVDHVLLEDGPAIWVDTHDFATTGSLARLAPSDRVLDRIEVARGFTAFQHYALIEALGERDLEGASLIVAPALDGMYRGDDLARGEDRELLLRVLAMLAGLAREYDLPVLATRVAADDLSGPIENAAEGVIHCKQTPMGPQFSTDAFETLVYPVSPDLVQTTLAFWGRVLEARAPLYETSAQPSPPEVTAGGTN